MAKCPLCEKPTAQDYRPFCSKRCADIDLGKWVTGSYALPSEDEVTPEDLMEAELDAHRRRES